MMIDLYIFDEGGVLCRDFDVSPEASRRLGISREEFWRFATPDIQALMRGDLDAEEYWGRFEKRSGLVVTENYWASLFCPRLDIATFELVDELRDGLKREGGGGVVGGTNTIPDHYAVHIAKGQYDCLDRVYASHLMGHAKPEPEFWLDILKAEAVPPERVFFADDLPENIEAARSLGIESRLYTDAAGLRRDLVELGAPLALVPAPRA